MPGEWAGMVIGGAKKALVCRNGRRHDAIRNDLQRRIDELIKVTQVLIFRYLLQLFLAQVLKALGADQIALEIESELNDQDLQIEGVAFAPRPRSPTRARSVSSSRSGAVILPCPLLACPVLLGTKMVTPTERGTSSARTVVTCSMSFCCAEVLRHQVTPWPFWFAMRVRRAFLPLKRSLRARIAAAAPADTVRPEWDQLVAVRRPDQLTSGQ